MIVVLLSDIGNTENLSPEINSYLSMNTYLKWDDPKFYDKLRFALPHRKSEKSRKHVDEFFLNYISRGNGSVKALPTVSISNPDDET